MSSGSQPVSNTETSAYSRYVDAFKNTAKEQLTSAGVATVLTAATLIGAKYFQVSALSLNLNKVSLGAVATLAGIAGYNGATLVGAAREEKDWKRSTLLVAGFSLAAFAATYFAAPQLAARSRGFIQVADKMTYAAIGAATASVYALTCLIANYSPKSQEAEKTVDQLKAMSAEDFAKLPAATTKFSDPKTQEFFNNRKKIELNQLKWDAAKYEASIVKDKFEIEAYTK